MAPAVCTCRVGDCNPLLQHNRSLAQQLLVAAWERTSREPSLPVPYLVYKPPDRLDVMSSQRSLLVVGMFGARKTQAVHCGICEKPRSSRAIPPGCRQLRALLRKQILKNHSGETDVVLLDKLGHNSFRNMQTLMLDAIFCLQPAGDTISRASFFQSILSGCIPVVNREDAIFLGELPFSRHVPYKKMWVHVAEDFILSGGDVVDVLRKVPAAEVLAKQVRLHEWADVVNIRSQEGIRAVLHAVWEEHV
eukprot:CAMPEP_0178388080 /NCGR_PEP_ID=MMETSP0689_2-20121128/9406_1 /TAXON_ID=160604 /ORGANISM="Amphidinium massartii, Strain CS-259" /LENGTH=248 /DNA_ID=CAMNT_0020008467 /DNA_START=609 /DNA_END=1355 /DNA_ORIENTATION=+